MPRFLLGWILSLAANAIALLLASLLIGVRATAGDVVVVESDRVVAHLRQ